MLTTLTGTVVVVTVLTGVVLLYTGNRLTLGVEVGVIMMLERNLWRKYAAMHIVFELDVMGVVGGRASGCDFGGNGGLFELGVDAGKVGRVTFGVGEELEDDGLLGGC